MNANKRRGDQFERDVVDVFRANGHPYAERLLRLGAHDDQGDVAGLPGLYVECRDRGTLDLGYWMTTTRVDAVAADSGGVGLVPVVVVKRRGKGAGQAYAVTELGDFARLIQ